MPTTSSEHTTSPAKHSATQGLRRLEWTRAKAPGTTSSRAIP